MEVPDPGVEPNEDERIFAMLAHIFQIFTYWVGPLVIYLVKRDSRFVAFHALQALFFQLVCFVLMFVTMVPMFFGMWLPFMKAAVANKPPAISPLPFILMTAFALLMIGYYVANLVCGIVFAVKAREGQWTSYPLLGRWAWLATRPRVDRQPLRTSL
jgi:uncharacterized Tic20 family protein